MVVSFNFGTRCILLDWSHINFIKVGSVVWFSNQNNGFIRKGVASEQFLVIEVVFYLVLLT